MARMPSLADQAAQIDIRSRDEALRRVTRRSTFNSRRMWVVVAIVWVVAAAILAVGLPRIG
jgi:hypothetical protein